MREMVMDINQMLEKNFTEWMYEVTPDHLLTVLDLKKQVGMVRKKNRVKPLHTSVRKRKINTLVKSNKLLFTFYQNKEKVKLFDWLDVPEHQMEDITEQQILEAFEASGEKNHRQLALQYYFCQFHEAAYLTYENRPEEVVEVIETKKEEVAKPVEENRQMKQWKKEKQKYLKQMQQLKSEQHTLKQNYRELKTEHDALKKEKFELGKAHQTLQEAFDQLTLQHQQQSDARYERVMAEKEELMKQIEKLQIEQMTQPIVIEVPTPEPEPTPIPVMHEEIDVQSIREKMRENQAGQGEGWSVLDPDKPSNVATMPQKVVKSVVETKQKEVAILGNPRSKLLSRYALTYHFYEQHEANEFLKQIPFVDAAFVYEERCDVMQLTDMLNQPNVKVIQNFQQLKQSLEAL